MKKIIQIARLELSLLFYSPIAWLLIIVLITQLNLAFMPGIPGLVQGGTFGFLTTIYANVPDKTNLLTQILEYLYLYIPLITMGIISKETSSGSIKLLYSSPVKLSQVIYGKFISMLIYNLVIIGILVLFMLIGAVFFVNFDYPHALVGLLAIFLLLSAYAAIGIFVSSLTTYQAVAAISTFVMLAFMNYIGTLGQDLDFIRDLTHSLSMPSRTERMIAGLLNTRDVIYYVVISGMFLAFTITKLELERLSRSFLQQASRYALILLVGLSIAYVSSRQPMIGYYDATATKTNTITKVSQEILKNMGEEPIEVTTYVNGLDDSYFRGAPIERISNIARWESYLRFKPNIKLKWVYYYDSVPGVTPQLIEQKVSFNKYVTIMADLQQIDITDFLSPQELKAQVDLRGESARLVMQLKYKGKTTFLRTFPAPDNQFWPSEAETGAALKRLIVTAPKLVFATDGYQRSMDKMGDRDYKVLANSKYSRSSLVNQGFDVDSVSLERNEIPKDIAALIIADPRVEFTAVAKTKLQKYIADGGNLMIAGEPGKQNVVNSLLDSLGVQMLNGTIVQKSRDYSFDLVTPSLAAGAVAMDKSLQQFYMYKMVVSMPNAGALSYVPQGGFSVHPLLMSDAQTSWIKKGKFVLDSATLVVDHIKGDQEGSFPTALMLTRNVKNKEQRIIVSADADFFSNTELSRNNLQTLNVNFAMSIFRWFSYGEFPIDTSRPASKDNMTTLIKDYVKPIQILYYFIIPGVIFLVGLILLIRRKRK
ncbi:ABC transporter permease [Pedobacter hiemivivus]|uniref:ABC transporter permease n=1 Tax=Pedobacter hiemivivus TaxID=2530454 RepID=A0A4U1FW95_9SPHI|nr:Gldg family protein [Pedobacter hiemivivus]TCC84489.1 ABC transporter permease [Pedobacter hiemivivus]TKC55177.1 ABC transporter permease [Pedobacter hiemivivus]